MHKSVKHKSENNDCENILNEENKNNAYNFF